MTDSQQQRRCQGTRQISEHHDDPRGPEFNNAPGSTAGGSIYQCPGCPDCSTPAQPVEQGTTTNPGFAHRGGIAGHHADLRAAPLTEPPDSYWPQVHEAVWDEDGVTCDAKIPVVPTSSLTAANQQIEELRERFTSLEESYERMKHARSEALRERDEARAKIEELTRERVSETEDAEKRRERMSDLTARLWAALPDDGEGHRDLDVVDAVKRSVLRAEAAEAQRDTLREGLEKALAVPDNNRYGQASDPGSVLRETRDVLQAVLSTPPAKGEPPAE